MQISGAKHVQALLDTKAYQHKEDVAKFKKDYPTKQPGENVKGKGWKSYSKIKYPSETFRQGYDEIDWS